MEKIVTINGKKWTITTACNEKMVVGLNAPNNASVYGMADSTINTIYLNENLIEDHQRSTLRHELAHAFMYSYGFMYVEKFNVEMVCEFIGTYGGQIEKIVNEVFPEEE